MEKFFEKFEHSKNIRHEQSNQLIDYLSKTVKVCYLKSEDKFNPDFSSKEKYIEYTEYFRKKLAMTIGYPPPSENSEIKAREEYVGEDELCYIYRLFISVDVSMECYGIYMIPKSLDKKAPLLLCLHGGGGCPEMICNFERTDNYNNASRRFLSEGFIVFSPLFSFRSFADEENTDIPRNLRDILDIRAKWAGTSLVAIETFKVIKALDYLLAKDEIDIENVGVAGLSYGGFYALIVAALEARIKFCISSCYFNDRILVNEKHPADFYDLTWKGSINEFSDVQLVALICPRLCFIEVGVFDELFPVEGARAMITKARKFYKELELEDRLVYKEFEGGHEFNLGFIEELKNYINICTDFK